MSDKIISKIGFYSSLTTAILSGAFSILVGLERVSGGWTYTNFPSPSSFVPMFVLNLFLPISFLIMAVSIHYLAAPKKRLFSLVGIAMAILYAAIVMPVYYTQLTVVIPHRLIGNSPDLAGYSFVPGSFQYAVEFLGCSLSSLAALFLAFAFGEGVLEKWIKGFLFITGLLGIPIILSINFPWFWFNLVPIWSIVFPGAAILLTIYFRKRLKGRLFT